MLYTSLLVAGLLCGTSTATLDDSVTYQVRQTVTLDAIGKDAKDVSWWVSIPGDARGQEILDITVVDAPGDWKIVHEPDHGNRFLRVDAHPDGAEQLSVTVDVTLRRDAVKFRIDSERVQPLDDARRAMFAEELRRDAPHMEVTAAIEAMAREACGDERNPAQQATRLLHHVAALADHYSKDPSKPNCGVGDASACIVNAGGCCTDLHSLFISLARAKGIPARLQMGYRLLGRNEGKEVDPGYRCWAEYFLSGYGWVPADIVEADATSGLGSFWFTGLTVERLWLNQGRNFRLDPVHGVEGVNHMSIGYALIDGVPARILPEGDLLGQLSRKIRFERVAGAPGSPLATTHGS